MYRFSFSFDTSSTTGFKFNSLRAILSTVLLVAYAFLSPVTSPFSLTPTPYDAFSFLPKPFPSLDPRWRSLDQNALARDLARQNTPALQASTLVDGCTFEFSLYPGLRCRMTS